MATLGHESQGVTITLDLLLAQGCPIREVVTVHTASPPVLRGLEEIRREFRSRRYPERTDSGLTT